MGFLILSSELFRHTYLVAGSARTGQTTPLPPAWAVPVPRKAERYTHIHTSLSSALFHEEEAELFMPNFFFKRHPRGGMRAELAEDEKPYTNIYTNGLLSNGRSIRSWKDVSSITLIAYAQVKYIYLSM